MAAYNNDTIKEIGDKGLAAIKQRVDGLGITRYAYSPDEKAFKNAISVKYRELYGQIDKISYTFPRTGIWLIKGVSRGHPANDPRTKKDWYNPAIDSIMPELEDAVADAMGDYIINNLTL